jgi:hypothetical protein
MSKTWPYHAQIRDKPTLRHFISDLHSQLKFGTTRELLLREVVGLHTFGSNHLSTPGHRMAAHNALHFETPNEEKAQAYGRRASNEATT